MIFRSRLSGGDIKPNFGKLNSATDAAVMGNHHGSERSGKAGKQSLRCGKSKLNESEPFDEASKGLEDEKGVLKSSAVDENLREKFPLSDPIIGNSLATC